MDPKNADEKKMMDHSIQSQIKTRKKDKCLMEINKSALKAGYEYAFSLEVRGKNYHVGSTLVTFNMVNKKKFEEIKVKDYIVIKDKNGKVLDTLTTYEEVEFDIDIKKIKDTYKKNWRLTV